MNSHDCLHPRDLNSSLTETKQTEADYRKQSLPHQPVHNRKSSIQHGGPMYLRHTKNSFRRMSIAQGIDPQSGLSMPELDDRRWSSFSDISNRDGIEDEDLCFLDNTTLDLQEINSEIQRVEHFMSVKNKHLKLDELQEDLTIFKKSVEFDEDSIKQKVTDRRKSIVEKASDRRLSNSVDLNDKSQGEPDLDEWKKDLHLNDKLISQLYEKVNDFLIRKDLEKDTKQSDDTFEVNIPHTNFPVSPDADLSEISGEDTIEPMTDDPGNAKHKRSPCIGFRDSLSCFRSYLALWMLQRQGLKDPITLRNIGKRAYSFRNVGKRGGVYSFRNIGKRGSSFSRNIDKRYAFNPLSDDNDEYDVTKRDFRFPRSYFRNVGKRKVQFEGNKRMAFRNIGKRFSFRNVGKRDDLFDRINRMAFRNIGKKDSYFGRDDRMAFRNIGKKDSTFGRDERMSFRNIGKKDSIFERDERMAFRNIGKRDPLLERNDRMSFRNIGKRDSLFARDDRLAFRNIGKKRSSLELSENDEKRSRFAGSSFRSIGKRNSDIVKDMSEVL